MVDIMTRKLSVIIKEGANPLDCVFYDRYCIGDTIHTLSLRLSP